MTNSKLSRWSLALVALALVAAGPARAGDSAQFSPNCNAILVNKQVGPEQWAITYDIPTRNVLGNVFKTDGSPASFLSCRFRGEDAGILTYECIGSQGCNFSVSEFCGGDQWTFIAEVDVPESFFLPEGLDELGSPDEVCIDIFL